MGIAEASDSGIPEARNPGTVSVEMALEALIDALKSDNVYSVETKDAVHCFSDYILKNSFVTFENAVYETRKGIPTGNYISRQIADCSMHWLLFKKLRIQHGKHWNLIQSGRDTLTIFSAAGRVQSDSSMLLLTILIKLPNHSAFNSVMHKLV